VYLLHQRFDHGRRNPAFSPIKTVRQGIGDIFQRVAKAQDFSCARRMTDRGSPRQLSENTGAGAGKTELAIPPRLPPTNRTAAIGRLTPRTSNPTPPNNEEARRRNRGR